MSFFEVAKTDDIPEGTMKPITAGDMEILVINYNGSYYATNRRCTHMGGDLSKGELEGKIVTCPRHGSKFDVTTGESISGPKIGFLKFKTKSVPVYEVKVEGSRISVNI